MRRVSKCTSMFVPTMHERGNIVITCRQFSTWVNNAQFSCPFLSLPPFPLNGIHEVSARDFVWTDGISTEISRLNPWDTKGGRFLSKIVRGANSFKVRILENCFWEYCWLILKNKHRNLYKNNAYVLDYKQLKQDRNIHDTAYMMEIERYIILLIKNMSQIH